MLSDPSGKGECHVTTVCERRLLPEHGYVGKRYERGVTPLSSLRVELRIQVQWYTRLPL